MYGLTSAISVRHVSPPLNSRPTRCPRSVILSATIISQQRRKRIHYTLVALAALALVWEFSYWNLLRF